MKKYYSLLVALMAILTSCTNDDIGTYNIGKFTYNVNTQNVFDDFNATSTIKNRFLSGQYGDYHLGVFTYIYDKDGNLVDSKVSYTKTFGTETYEFTLKTGSYTAVSIEMIVDKDDNYQSPRFELKGTEKLSTIEIAYRTYTGNDGNSYYYSTSLWYQCIGVAVNSFNVNASLSAFIAIPKPIGVIVNCSFYNFNNSTYDYLLLRTKNAPIGRYLDPSKTGDDRFKYESYNEGNNVTIREYIHKTTMDDEENLDVYLLEEGTDIDCRLGARHYPEGWYTNGQLRQLEDGKTYYAGLYYIGGTEGSDLNGGIFDNANAFNSWFNTAKTLYKPTSSLVLTEPLTTWGSTVSTVQSAMNDYTMINGEVGKAIYSSENSYNISYAGNGPELAFMYYFTSETSGLYQSVAAYSKTDLTEEQILAELKEKYTYLSSSGNYYFFMTNDQKSYITLMGADDYWFVQFIDPSSINESSAPAIKLPNGNTEKVLKERANVRNFMTKEKTMIPLDITRDNLEMRLCKNSK